MFQVHGVYLVNIHGFLIYSRRQDNSCIIPFTIAYKFCFILLQLSKIHLLAMDPHPRWSRDDTFTVKYCHKGSVVYWCYGHHNVPMSGSYILHGHGSTRHITWCGSLGLGLSLHLFWVGTKHLNYIWTLKSPTRKYVVTFKPIKTMLRYMVQSMYKLPQHVNVYHHRAPGKAGLSA